MPKASKGARFGLGEPWTSDLADFCAANYHAPEREVIREALSAHIEARINAEPELRRRFEEVRKKRLKARDKIVRIVPTTK